MSSRPKDRHHILPRVRCRDLGINPNFKGNVIRVKTTKHRAWHTLFGSQTAEEAIETIRREWSLSEEAQEELNRLLRHRNKCARCQQWICPGYEVFYQKRPYHSQCAAQQSKVVKRKKHPQFRVLIGGKK